MDVKFGKVKHTNLFSAASTKASALNVEETADENIFAKSLQGGSSNAESQVAASPHRLNDYDSNILENNAYRALPDEMLKVEHKIGMLENSLAKINAEIATLESFGETVQMTDIKSRKKALEKELIQMNKQYGEMGISAKISGQIASVVKFTSGKKTGNPSKVKEFLSKKVLPKISKKFGYSQDMKEALAKLSSINSNVDELVTMQVPYGETIDRYEKLTAYLNKANIIHSQISKDFKGLK